MSTEHAGQICSTLVSGFEDLINGKGEALQEVFKICAGGYKDELVTWCRLCISEEEAAICQERIETAWSAFEEMRRKATASSEYWEPCAVCGAPAFLYDDGIWQPCDHARAEATPQMSLAGRAAEREVATFMCEAIDYLRPLAAKIEQTRTEQWYSGKETVDRLQAMGYEVAYHNLSRAVPVKKRPGTGKTKSEFEWRSALAWTAASRPKRSNNEPAEGAFDRQILELKAARRIAR